MRLHPRSRPANYWARPGAGPSDVGAQSLRTFSPADIDTLKALPEIEAKYRLLRNEWLAIYSQHRQAEEWVIQAERSGGPTEIAEAREHRSRIATRLGWYRRMTLLCRQRAEAEVFSDIARQVLPKEIYQLLESLVEETLERRYDDVVRGSKAQPTAEDYKLLDDMLACWGPLWREERGAA